RRASDAQRRELRPRRVASDAEPRDVALQRCLFASLEISSELDHDAALVAAEDRSELQLDLTAVELLGRRSDGAHDPHLTRKPDSGGGAVNRGLRRLPQLLVEESGERGSVLDECEVAMAGSSDAAHVRLVEVEADAERRDGERAFRAVTREPLRV